jgi:hypothetical protein
MSATVFGFAPNYYYNQQSAGLAIYVSPGQVGTKQFPGKVIQVPANATTQISADLNGNVFLGVGPFPIATVITGLVQTAGTPNTFPSGGPVSSPGILSIQDIRPQSAF